jgi:hypothetical protein
VPAVRVSLNWDKFFPPANLKVRLSKVVGGEAVRTSEVVGTAAKLPGKGEQLVVLADPIVTGTTGRRVNTSPVVSYEDVAAGRLIRTKSGSQYFIEVLEKLK